MADKWNRSMLTKLVSDDWDGYARLAKRYGISATTDAGRRRRSPAVVNEILAAQKEQGYKPVPRASKEKEEEETPTEPVVKKKKKSKPEPEPEPAEEPPLKKKKTKDSPGGDGTSLSLWLGMVAMLHSIEHDFVTQFRNIVDRSMERVGKLTRHGSKEDLGRLVGGVGKKDSPIGAAAATLGLKDDDFLTEVLIRVGSIGNDG